MNFGIIFRLASGFGFLAVSRSMESRGDIHALMGDRQGALNMHLAALFMLVLAALCFITAGLKIMRGSKKTPPSRNTGPAYSSLAKSDDDTGFDADAALARYLENRNVEGPEQNEPQPPRPPVPPRTGFGRKLS